MDAFRQYAYVAALIAGLIANYAIMQDRLSTAQTQIQELNDDLDEQQKLVTQILIDQRLVQLRLDMFEEKDQ